MSKALQVKNVVVDQIDQAYKKLKVIKYPVRPISSAIPRAKKLNHFSSSINKKLEKELDKSLNVYRQVRGDGNCFFRAFAFTYISGLRSTKLEDIFPYINKISLQVCTEDSIPKEFKPFYKDNLLKGVLQKYWKKDYDFFYDNNNYNYKRGLARLLTQQPFFDFIIILYFRALCLYSYEQRKQQIKEFLDGSEHQAILTYGQESQGMLITLISKLLQITIYIYEVRKDEIIPYQYSNQKRHTRNSVEVNLLFYDNHYDLFEQNYYYKDEEEDQKVEEEAYYTKVDDHFIKGKCIQCQKQTDINEETGLCKDCFNKSMENLQKFKKDRQIEGYCIRCDKLSRRLSEQLKMCKFCIQSLQYSPATTKRTFGSSYLSKIQESKRLRQDMKQCMKCYKWKGRLSFQNNICLSCLEEENQIKAKKSPLKNQSSNVQTSAFVYKSGLYNLNVSKKESPSKNGVKMQISGVAASLQDNRSSKFGKDKDKDEKQLQTIYKASKYTYPTSSSIKSKINNEQQLSKLRKGSNKKEELCCICKKRDQFYSMTANGICQKCLKSNLVLPRRAY